MEPIEKERLEDVYGSRGSKIALKAVIVFGCMVAAFFTVWGIITLGFLIFR